MLTSIAIIFLCGLILSTVFQKLRLPGLVGLLLTGILLGPYCLNLISAKILDISTDLREIALVVILTRAGLAMDFKDLKKVGRPAVLMCFVPATFEILGIVLLAPVLFKISLLEAAILGAVLGAVSPAVVVPKMLGLLEKGYGKEKSIPQLIMAGASVDDIYTIVLFTSFMGMYKGSGFNPMTLLSVPVSIITGIVLGAVSGIILAKCFKKYHMRDTVKTVIIFSFSFLFITVQKLLEGLLPLSGLLAVMAMGAALLKKSRVVSERLSKKYSKIWVVAEIVLFVLVGAAVNIKYLAGSGIMAVLLIFGGLVVRMIGVQLSLLGTHFNQKEKLFCTIAYMPKATVQAAIGSLPLAAGVGAGNIILSVAVLAIIITAPLGAVGIDSTYKRLLK